MDRCSLASRLKIFLIRFLMVFVQAENWIMHKSDLGFIQKLCSLANVAGNNILENHFTSNPTSINESLNTIYIFMRHIKYVVKKCW